jgi:hypothetical protein
MTPPGTKGQTGSQVPLPPVTQFLFRKSCINCALFIPFTFVVCDAALLVLVLPTFRHLVRTPNNSR